MSETPVLAARGEQELALQVEDAVRDLRTSIEQRFLGLVLVVAAIVWLLLN